MFYHYPIFHQDILILNISLTVITRKNNKTIPNNRTDNYLHNKTTLYSLSNAIHPATE